ncbi:MAG: PepSY-associated TM helix domain-containing protein [Bacteroidales bacterium]|nr:PepSY-associated TM helix domain-containing protein [Bacteroidales bacterium]MCF8334612.1 PepSY-associated TM helix domain-containing protein [Bacteroidales bacterium]
MKLKTLRRWNRATHRDLGYFFFGVTLIYAISGIALNHLDDFNPNYSVINSNYIFEEQLDKKEVTKAKTLEWLSKAGYKDQYKKHYFPDNHTVKIFLKNGSMIVDLQSGEGNLELLEKRPLLYEFNYLHYNPIKWWTYFSDIYCVALILIAITGLFIVRGKNGIKRRGAILTIAGIIIPVIFIVILM